MSKKKEDHLNDMLEWQEHQYDPGHYTGGKIHPFYKATGNPKLMAIWWFFQAALGIFVYFIIIYRLFLMGDNITFTFGEHEGSPLLFFIFFTVFMWLLILLYAWIGIRYYATSKQKKKVPHQHKKKKHH